VLVILGILAAVAVPKFMSLTDEARQRAVDGAISAGMSSVSMQYARLSLKNDAEPDLTSLAAAALSQIGGDFTFSFTPNGTNGIMITVQGEGKTATYLWKMPGM